MLNLNEFAFDLKNLDPDNCTSCCEYDVVAIRPIRIWFSFTSRRVSHRRSNLLMAKCEKKKKELRIAVNILMIGAFGFYATR